MSDEEMMVIVRRTDMRRKAGLILMLVGGILGIAGLTQILPGDPGDVGSWRLEAFGGIAVVLMAAGLVLRLVSPMPPEASTGRLAMMRAEQLQSKRQTAFLLMPLSLGLMLMGVIRATARMLEGHGMRHLDMFVIACFVGFIIAFAALLSGRGLDRWAKPVLDDELSRDLRRRALQLGYLILLPGVCALFIVGLVDRDLAVELTPVLAALGVGAPAVRLFWLERSANADEA